VLAGEASSEDRTEALHPEHEREAASGLLEEST
jgi:hypothetical protein